MAALAVPHMYRPRLDYRSLPAWTYAADNTPLKETLERLDWDQVRDPDHMRVFVSPSDDYLTAAPARLRLGPPSFVVPAARS